MNNINDPTMVIDVHDYRIVMANKYARDRAGVIDPVGQFMTCYQFSHHRESPCSEGGEVCHLQEVVKKKIPVKVTHTHVDADNNEFIYSIIASPIFARNGEVIQVVESARDITLELSLEAQLLQSQKMEAIGLLAGGIAHDLNNLLTGILGSTQLLKQLAEPQDEVFKTAEVIENAGERAARLTEQLLGYARKGKLQHVAVDMHQTTRGVVELLRHLIDKNITIDQNLDAEKFVVMGDPNQMEQVLLNLAVNARDAMPQGGRMVFSTAVVIFDAEYVKNHQGATPGPSLMIAVEDNGEGIEQELLERIFEPFFTTKELGKGTGMGLAMVYGIVKNHSGYIQVYSEVGKGTNIKVYLPLAPLEAKAVTKSVAVSGKIIGGKERILLVDDEEMILTVTSKLLTKLGYQVVTAKDGEQAAEYFQEHSAEIDLVILDYMMPKMGGRECFKALKAIKSEVKVIVSSGYGVDGMIDELRKEGIEDLIQKPYRINFLAQKIREILD